MTAIGLLLFSIGVLYGVWIYSPFRSNDTVAGIFGWLIVIGASLIVAGTSIWLWRVMP